MLPAMIDQWVIDKVLLTASLVDLIDQTVPLRRCGDAWVGRCPSCADGVLCVYQSPARCLCTNPSGSCPEWGDAIRWIQRRDPSLDFAQAVTRLAFFGGIPGLIKQTQPMPGG